MALKLRLDEQAKRDVAEIRAYLVERYGEATANRVRDHLRERFRKLQAQPLILGVDTTEPGIRYLAPSRYPYRIDYTVTEVTVVILHVRHAARLDPDLGELGH
jgi:plasmid stabilization system protein ParE